MRVGIASWSFLLCTLLVFLIVKDNGARKIATTSGKDIQLKDVSHHLHQLATEGLVLSDIMQVESAVVEMNKKPAHKHGDDDDDDSEDEDGDGDDSEDEDDDDDDGSDDEDDGGDNDDNRNHKKPKSKHVRGEEGGGYRKKKGKRVGKEEKNKDEHKKITGKDVHAYKSSRKDHSHMDPELNVFFIPSDLRVGKIMPIYFSSKKDSSKSPKFLPREEADQIPFSSKQLPFLLNYFSIPKHSPQAKAMKYTLKQCEFEAMEGETKFCATSLESLFDFARYLFGSNAQFKVLTTTHLTNSPVLLQNYTISQVEKLSVPYVIGCHPMPYPFAVFYCHSQQGDTSLYEVKVEGQNGGRVQAAAICHMDTSKWDADHVAFRVLKVEPGTSPVCHFFPPDNLAWVPLPAAP